MSTITIWRATCPCCGIEWRDPAIRDDGEIDSECWKCATPMRWQRWTFSDTWAVGFGASYVYATKAQAKPVAHEFMLPLVRRRALMRKR